MLGKVWAVAAKDLLQLARDRNALVLMFVVPLVLMGILGAAFLGFSGNGPTVKATLPVVDHDGGAPARSLVDALRHVPSLTVQMHTDENAMKTAVRDRDQVGLLIIPKGFSAALRSPHPTARVTYYAVANNANTDAQFAHDAVQSMVQRFAFQSVTAFTIAQAQVQATGRVDPAVVSRLTAQAGS